jgi:hypothetical protein
VLLLHRMSRLLALTDQQPSMDSTAAIGGAADMNGLRPAGRTVENDPGCVKTLRGITAPGILGSVVMRRAKKRKNLSSARHYDQIRFRFHTTKTLNRHNRRHFAVLHNGAHDVVVYGRRPRGRAR